MFCLNFMELNVVKSEIPIKGIISFNVRKQIILFIRHLFQYGLIRN